MAEIPEGAELITGHGLRFPNVAMRNVYVLPGVPEIFRRKFDAMRERFRDAPIHLKNVFVRIGEGTLAEYLNRLLGDFPLLLIGSYPELSNPEYQVKVTLESRDRGYLEQALADFLGRLPNDAVVKVSRRERRPVRGIPLGVALVAAALYLLRLGGAPFIDPPEGFHAEIAREMMRVGDWITPHANGVRYFDKPPVLYWLMAGSFSVAGVGEAKI